MYPTFIWCRPRCWRRGRKGPAPVVALRGVKVLGLKVCPHDQAGPFWSATTAFTIIARLPQQRFRSAGLEKVRSQGNGGASVFRNLYSNHCFFAENKNPILHLPTPPPTLSPEKRRFTQNNRSRMTFNQATRCIVSNGATSLTYTWGSMSVYRRILDVPLARSEGRFMTQSRHSWPFNFQL